MNQTSKQAFPPHEKLVRTPLARQLKEAAPEPARRSIAGAKRAFRAPLPRPAKLAKAPQDAESACTHRLPRAREQRALANSFTIASFLFSARYYTRI